MIEWLLYIVLGAALGTVGGLFGIGGGLIAIPALGVLFGLDQPLAQGTALEYTLNSQGQAAKRGEWGKLPKKLADQLTKGQQEAVAGDYRQAVETYYKVIAEKAKQQK